MHAKYVHTFYLEQQTVIRQQECVENEAKTKMTKRNKK